MRVSRTQAEENRQAVINVASRLFREHGFDGIGLKDLMAGAGMTQGAFYKQFDSKEDLVAQASQRALQEALGRWSAAAASRPMRPSPPWSIFISARLTAPNGRKVARWLRSARMRRGMARMCGPRSRRASKSIWRW